MTALKHPGGRPSIYSKELADKICSELAKGRSLRNICKEDSGMPTAATVHYWLLDKEKTWFFEQYARAREIQAENMFDEILAISDESRSDIFGDDKSDNARVQAHKLRVDSRKWYLSKVLPKKFGEKIDMTTNGKDLPTPLLHVIRDNKGNPEDIRSQEEN